MSVEFGFNNSFALSHWEIEVNEYEMTVTSQETNMVSHLMVSPCFWEVSLPTTFTYVKGGCIMCKALHCWKVEDTGFESTTSI